MFPAMSRRAIILGAGVCGLAAAYRLLEREPSIDLTVLELEDRPGGLARSLTVDGQVTDLGPHRIFTELPDVKTFLRDLAGENLETVKRSSRMWLRGGWIEYPPKTAEITRHLGFMTLAKAGASFALHRGGSLLGKKEGGEDTFESLMVDAFGPDLYKLLVGPYAEKVWKVPASQIHGDVARVRVSAGGLDQMIKKVIFGEDKKKPTAVKEFFYIAGGVEKLVDKLREGVVKRGGKLLLDREVTDIIVEEKKPVQIEAINRATGARERFEARNAISTIPVTDLLRMLLKHRPDNAIADIRKDLNYIANILVCLVIDKPSVTDAQWLYFPEDDTIFNRGYEPKNFHQSMGSKEQSMIVLEITCHPGDKTWGMTDEALLEETIKGVERVGLLKKDDIQSTLVHRIPNTYPFYDTGYRDRMKAIIEYLGEFPYLISAGRQGLYLHNNMDHSIHMGFRAAHHLMAGKQNPAKAFYHEVPRFQEFRIVD